MALPERVLLTEAEYVAFERAADTKHEYRQGEVVALAGASRAHNLITANILAGLVVRLRGRPCETYMSEMRVRVRDAGLYTYPDVVVVCGEPQFDDAELDMLLNPTVLIEVLSPSTEAYDRGRKFRDYRALRSLREYITVAQDEPRAEQFLRREDGRWLWREVASLDDTLELPALGCALPLREIYERVSFPSPPEAPHDG